MSRWILLVALAACGGSGTPAPHAILAERVPYVTPAAPRSRAAAVTGMASCDEYVARAYAFAQCPIPGVQLHAAYLDMLSQLIAPTGWPATPENRRAEADVGCAQAVVALRASAEASACELAIPSDDYIGTIRRSTSPITRTGDPDLTHCALYLGTLEQYVTCQHVPLAARESTREPLELFRSFWSGLDAASEDARTRADARCWSALDALAREMKAVRCDGGS